MSSPERTPDTYFLVSDFFSAHDNNNPSLYEAIGRVLSHSWYREPVRGTVAPYQQAVDRPAFYRFAVQQIEQVGREPEKSVIPEPPVMPDGPPIGEDRMDGIFNRNF